MNHALAKRALKIHERLLEFYGEPIWRNPLPAIDELVSTILSQNTNDINRDRAFNALRAKFGTWEEVRDADDGGCDRSDPSGGACQSKGTAHSAGLAFDHRRTRQSGSVFSWGFICGGSAEPG